MAAGMWQRASNVLSKALEADSNNAILLCMRSACFAQLNMLELSLLDAELCTQSDAHFAEGYFRKGESLRLMKRYPLALVSLERATELAPSVEKYSSTWHWVKEKVDAIPADAVMEKKDKHIRVSQSATAATNGNRSNDEGQQQLASVDFLVSQMFRDNKAASVLRDTSSDVQHWLTQTTDNDLVDSLTARNTAAAAAASSSVYTNDLQLGRPPKTPVNTVAGERAQAMKRASSASKVRDRDRNREGGDGQKVVPNGATVKTPRSARVQSAQVHRKRPGTAAGTGGKVATSARSHSSIHDNARSSKSPHPQSHSLPLMYQDWTSERSSKPNNHHPSSSKNGHGKAPVSLSSTPQRLAPTPTPRRSTARPATAEHISSHSRSELRSPAVQLSPMPPWRAALRNLVEPAVSGIHARYSPASSSRKY